MHVDLRAAVEHLLRSVERGVEPRRGAAVAHQLTLRLEQADVPAVSYSETKEALGSVLERIAALLSETEVSERLELRISGALAAGSQRALVATESMRRDFDVSRPRTQAEHKAVALFTIADSVSPRRMRPGDIADVLRQILLDAQLCNEDPIDCQLWARTLLSLARTGEFALADQFARHAQDMSASRGLLAAQAEYSLTLAMSLTMQGSIVEASSHVLNSLSVADGRGWSRRPDAVACLVANLIHRGRCDEAETVLSRFSGLEQEMSAFEGPCLLEQRGGCAVAKVVLQRRSRTSWRREVGPTPAGWIARSSRPGAAKPHFCSPKKVEEKRPLLWRRRTSSSLACTVRTGLWDRRYVSRPSLEPRKGAWRGSRKRFAFSTARLRAFSWQSL